MPKDGQKLFAGNAAVEKLRILPITVRRPISKNPGLAAVFEKTQTDRRIDRIPGKDLT